MIEKAVELQFRNSGSQRHPPLADACVRLVHLLTGCSGNKFFFLTETILRMVVS